MSTTICRAWAARSILLLFFAVLTAAVARAQISDKVANVTAGTFHPGQPLTIEADLLVGSVVDRMSVAYRSFGARDYKQVEMTITGSHASVSIPAASLIPPSLEYYLLLYIRAKDTTETYPVEDAALNPLRVALEAPPAVSSNTIVILSPDRDELVTPDDLLISFSLVHADSTVNRANIKIFVDNEIGRASCRERV